MSKKNVVEPINKDSKPDRIVARLINDIPEEEIAEALDRDGRYRTLKLKIEEAKRRHYFVGQMMRDLQTAQQLVLDKLCREKFEKYTVNGSIVKYLDKEDRDNYNEYRALYKVTQTVLGKILHDMQTVLNDAGLGADLCLSRDIQNATASIEKFNCSDDIPQSTKYDDIWQKEIDMLYNHISKRSPFLLKKIRERYAEIHKDDSDGKGKA